MRISEVVDVTKVGKDLLRYYEKLGLICASGKDCNGDKLYSSEDIKRVKFIKNMRDAGVSLDVLKKYVDLSLEGDSTIAERKELLEDERKNLINKIDVIQEALESLKIELNY